MKLFVTLLALTGIAAAVADYTKEQEEVWLNFKLDYGKLFLSPGKEKQRKDNFLKNYDEIKAHNEAYEKGESLYEMDVNQYTDLSKETFMKRFTGVVVPEHNKGKGKDREHEVSLRQTPPQKMDLRTHAGVGPIKDQNPCGSCWAFSTCASLEYAYWRKTGKVVDLSEQHLVDCVYKRDGCQGGWMADAMNFVQTNSIATEDEYPYQKRFGQCNRQCARKRPVAMKKDKSNFKIADDDIAIKNALNTYGVLAICVDAGGWSGYKQGIYTMNNYNSAKCTHAVNLVGYDMEYDQRQQRWIPYWIVRNSWNTWFGEKGYIRMLMDRDPVTKKNKAGFKTDYIWAANIE
ncbi:uncharacterized protein LOC134833251 [Culicoides brevitarsis]|uniref:uncharacterized protein LOC134833251 n=1 Tax=Culicoides brevitarsis TaxID=469753 RepID=UPI00307C0F9D